MTEPRIHEEVYAGSRRPNHFRLLIENDRNDERAAADDMSGYTERAIDLFRTIYRERGLEK